MECGGIEFIGEWNAYPNLRPKLIKLHANGVVGHYVAEVVFQWPVGVVFDDEGEVVLR